MLNLNGILDAKLIHQLADYTSMRFKSPEKYRCAEALGMYEQKILDNSEIFNICQKAAGTLLYEPITSYIPAKILHHFGEYRYNSSRVVPVAYSPQKHRVTCVYLEDVGKDCITPDGYNVEFLPTTIYYYFTNWLEHYGTHPDLGEVPTKQLFDAIVDEAISLEAMDITFESIGKSARCFFNVRKRKRYSQRILSANNIQDIIKICCKKSPMTNDSNAPKYVGIDLNDDYRGRVVINKTFSGNAITIRTLPNWAFDKYLEDLNLSRQVVDMIRKNMMNKELGLRLIVGSTASGKNTSNLAILHELIQDDTKKVVSVEMPVEQFLDGVIQINCENEDEFALNVSSLLRQNPDIVYITEIGDTNANEVMTLANTGKVVFSTLHANGCADVIGRLTDITKLSTDKIIQVLHSVVYQELIRDEATDTISPRNKFVYFSRELKNKLYGKPYGEVIKIIQEWEGGDLW